MKSFTLEIITQERHVLTETVQQISVDTEAGQITVLSDHIPLFSRLKPGELSYTSKDKTSHYAITGGFIEVSPTNVVTILSDSALRSDEINLQKAEKAIESAKKALESAVDSKDMIKVEIELRKAMIQANVARKYNRAASN